MSKHTTIEQSIKGFRAHSEAHGIHWPSMADAAYVAGMGAAFHMAIGKSEVEVRELIVECVLYAMSQRTAAKQGTMPA